MDVRPRGPRPMVPPPRPRPRRRRHPVATAAPAALALLLLLLGALGAAAQVGRGKRLPECALVSVSSTSYKIRRGGKKLVMKNPRVEVTTGISSCAVLESALTSRPDLTYFFYLTQFGPVAQWWLTLLTPVVYTEILEEIEYLGSNAVDCLESRLLLPKRFAKQCAATYAKPPTSSKEDVPITDVDGAVLSQTVAVIGAVPRYAKTKSTGVEKLIYDVAFPPVDGGTMWWETREALGSSAGGCNLYFATPCQTDAQP